MASIIEVLPFDIIKTIIDILASDKGSYTSLRTCSLTCQAFVPLCQQELFRSIALNHPETQSKSRQLAEHSPRIVEYVRKLEYTPTEEDATLLLKLFTMLRSVCVHFRIIAFRQLWKNISPSLRSALVSLFHLPFITMISLKYIKDFDCFNLLPCTNLRDLELEDVDFAEWDEASPPLNTSAISIKLNRLRIRDTYSTTVSGLAKMTRPYFADGTPILDLRELADAVITTDKVGPIDEMLSNSFLLKKVGLFVKNTPENKALIDKMKIPARIGPKAYWKQVV